MPNISNNPDAIREVLENAKVIAVVGHSHLRDKASYRIADYLRGSGYTVYAVNPTVD
ncbi:MAG: CoA-binding protein, partial [Chloroflexota bacterium]